MSDTSINDNERCLNPSASLLASMSDPPWLIAECNVADSGATAHFGTLTLPVKNQQATTNPILIRMPNGTITASTHEGELDWPDIPEGELDWPDIPEAKNSPCSRFC